MRFRRRRPAEEAPAHAGAPEPEEPTQEPPVEKPRVASEPEVREALRHHLSARTRARQLFVNEFGWAAAILLALAILITVETIPDAVWIPITGFLISYGLIYAAGSRWAKIPTVTLFLYKIQPDGMRDTRIIQVARALWAFIRKQGQSNTAVSPALGEFYHIEDAKWLDDDCPTEVTYAYSGGSDIDLVTRKEVLDHVKAREAVATKLAAKQRLLGRIAARDLAVEAAEEIVDVLSPLPKSAAAVERTQRIEDEVDELYRQLNALRRTSQEQPVEQPADIAVDGTTG